jgi:hypothetical protein
MSFGVIYQQISLQMRLTFLSDHEYFLVLFEAGGS